MVALDDFIPCTEEQKSAGAIGAFCFSLTQALVTNQGSLLVSNKTSNRHSSECPVSDVTVDFRSRDEFGKNRWSQTKELEETGLPLECCGVEQECARCVGDFADVLALLNTSKQILSFGGSDAFSTLRRYERDKHMRPKIQLFRIKGRPTDGPLLRPGSCRSSI